MLVIDILALLEVILCELGSCYWVEKTAYSKIDENEIDELGLGRGENLLFFKSQNTPTSRVSFRPISRIQDLAISRSIIQGFICILRKNRWKITKGFTITRPAIWHVFVTCFSWVNIWTPRFEKYSTSENRINFYDKGYHILHWLD